MKDTDKPEQSEQDKAQARKWGKRLKRALEQQKKSGQEADYKRFRKYVRGDVGDDGQGGLVRTNIIHSNFAAILPQIYAKNPEISVVPSESVEDDGYEWIGNFCRTLQIVIDRKLVKDAQLKKRAKSAIRAAMTTGIGWVKVSWQRDVRRDPLIENRIADSQDNLQRIRKLIADIEDGDESRGELEAKQAELQQQIAALEAEVEVSVAEGLVIDRPLTEDIFILDDTMYDFDCYEQAEAIAHRVWMTCEQYEEAFGCAPPKTATKYGQDKNDKGGAGAADGEVSLVAVFEVWHRASSTVFTLCAGGDEWARDPYQPDVTGERFYPFFALAFNPVDGRVAPISDAELLIELQDEYNTTRTNFAEHRRENLPVRVYRKSGSLNDTDVKALTNRRANDWVGIEGDPNVPVERDIAILNNPPVDPATYDVSQILRDAEMTLGAGDAAKGTINKAKTATEAEIMAQGLQSRVGERQDVVEDWIAEQANYAAEILLQMLSPEQVKRLAGEAAVWPQMSKDEIFDLVNIDIRAGSTGRPNQAREREQWATMLPQIQQVIAQVGQLRQAGQDDMADSMIKLLEETLRRFDERIDIDAFIPQKEDGGQPQIPAEVQRQLEQGKAMLEQLQMQNAELQKALDDKQADQQAAAEKAQVDAAASVEQARIKAEAQAQAAIEVARVKAESDERMAAMNAQQSQLVASALEQMREMMACMMQHAGKPDAGIVIAEEDNEQGATNV